VADVEQLNGARLIDEVFKTYVEPALVQPTFVLDYPVALSPLAKLSATIPRSRALGVVRAGSRAGQRVQRAERPDEQRRRFEQQQGFREKGDAEAQRLDEDFLRALEYGMPPTGGVGLGVDRLTMILADQAISGTDSLSRAAPGMSAALELRVALRYLRGHAASASCR